MFCKKEVVFIAFLMGFFLIGNVSSLGISPALKEYNFEPGMKQKIVYTVYGGGDKELYAVAKGNLTEYVTINKKVLKPGDDTFSVEINLPKDLETPGRNRLLIEVGETIDEELSGPMIRVTVAIRGVVDVYVPYPGRYLETTLSSNNVNVGEPVTFDLKVISRGDQDVAITPKIDIFNSVGSRVDTLYLNERLIKSQETLYLKKVLETKDYNPGNYKAQSIIDYGALAKSETEFKIGDLFIEILNYSNEFYIDGLKKFELVIQSGWNDEIKGAYADITFSNSSGVIENFKTINTDLTPWEVKNVEGYFDTSKFVPGIYEAEVKLFYFGGEQQASSGDKFSIYFLEKEEPSKIWYYIGGGGIVLLAIALLMRLFLFKKHGKTKRSKK